VSAPLPNVTFSSPAVALIIAEPLPAVMTSPCAEDDHVGARAAGDRVARATVNRVSAGRARRDLHIAGAAVDIIAARPARDHIADAAEDRRRAACGDNGVVADDGVDGFAAVAAGDRITAQRVVNGVIAVQQGERVAADQRHALIPVWRRVIRTDGRRDEV
jgi:hypothetical protein